MKNTHILKSVPDWNEKTGTPSALWSQHGWNREAEAQGELVVPGLSLPDSAQPNTSP